VRILGVMLIIGILCAGCSTAFRATSYQEFGNRISGSDGRIVCRNGIDVSAEEMAVIEDSLRFRIADSMRDTSVSLSDVESVVLSNRIRGAIDGAFLGVMGVGGLGLIGGGAAALSSSAQDSGLAIFFGAYYGVIIGGALGSIAGAIYGHHTKCFVPKDTLTIASPLRVAP
jgi:hypothetical protein